MNNPFEYAKELSQDGVFINFYGPISQAILVELGDILKHKLKVEAVDLNTTHKIFSLLVEQTQNILSYIRQTSLPVSTSDLISFRNGTISVGYVQRRAENLLQVKTERK